MASRSEVYYRPYTSDSDSDTDSESGSEASDTTFETDSTSSSYAARVADEIPRNFRALAAGLSLDSLAGPPFQGPSTVLNYSAAGTSKYGSPYGGEGFPTFSNYQLPPDASNNKVPITEKSINNIIMLDSRDRDKAVYPQPTALTLRLPRLYSNITDFQLVQVKLLSAFLYFRNAKHNTDISILELDRTNLDTFGNLVPAIIKNFIREGSYDINGLLSELTTQLNRTPIFYDFPNGFQDFAPQFAATGNFALGFNLPGDTYYDSLLDQFIANPTTTQIVSRYFQSQYAGLSSYSTNQIKVAYYYPVVKEILLDQDFPDALDLSLPPAVAAALLPSETVYSRCVYTFQGLNDVVVQQVILQNIAVLDNYRLRHTFRYSLINKYVCSYETQNNRVTISCPSLNTSLFNLITYKQSQFFAEQLSENNLTQDQYNQLQTQNTLLLAVLNDMYYYIQRYLATIFGIPFNSYTLNYLATASNLLPLQNAYQATGVSSNFDLAVLSRTTDPQDTSILSTLQQDAKRFWNRLSNLPEPTIPFPYNLETGSPATSSNYPYSILLDQQIRDYSFVDTATEYIYTNRLTKSADIVVPLEATKYTVFRFKSPVRQTLQVETLPRPTKYRYPAFNAAAYDLSAQTLFDNSYSFIETAQNVAMDVAANFSTTSLQFIPGFSTLGATANFGASYASSIALWDSTTSLVEPGATRAFFQFYTPWPADYLSTPSAAYRYPMSFTLSPTATATGPPVSSFSAAMNFYLYHDRGAFMADVSDNRNEKAIHYLSTTSVSSLTTAAASTATFSFDVYANQTYYILAKSQSATPTTQHFRVTPWFPAGTSYTALTSTLSGFNPTADPQTPAALSNFNYAAVADPAFIKLPIQPAIQTSTTQNALAQTLSFSTALMGYDVSGVSTDLTAYCGFVSGQPLSTMVPTTTIRVDPVSGYAFQVGAGYNSTSQTYTAPASSNTILKPQGTGTYVPRTIPARETNAVHWYGTTYLPNSLNQAPMLSSFLADPAAIQPYNSTVTNAPLAGYQYAGSNGALQLGDGVVATSFVPSQGLWDIQRIMFKSAYTSSNAATDENLNIKYIGVFPSALAQTQFLHEFSLSSATAVLKFNKAVAYSASSFQNYGFDSAGGTYYEFTRDSNFRIGSTSYLAGYTQIRSTINTDINSMYSFYAFDAGSNNTYFTGLVGSPVPYPFYSDASASLTYSDGTAPLNGKGIVVPSTKVAPDSNRGPPTGYDETQCKYEQSMTIGTNHLQYAVPYAFNTVSTAMKAWNPLPYNPSLIVGDVSGYFLTQDSFYRVFEYEGPASSNLDLTERYQFTLDQIYPASNTDINFIGVTANEAEYAFFAYSNASPPAPSTSRLLIRTMRPADGTVTRTYEYANLPGFDPQLQHITNVTYNNFGGFTMGLKTSTSFGVLAKTSATTSTMTYLSSLGVVGGSNADLDVLLTRQSPKEQFGGFYVFPSRTGLAGPISQGIYDYVKVTPSNAIVSHNANYSYQALTGNQDTWGTSQTPCQLQVFNFSNALNSNKVYREPIIARNPFQEYIYLLTAADTTHFYSVTGTSASNAAWHTSNSQLTQGAYTFPFPTSNLTPGASGAKWSLVQSTIFGNRDNFVDSPKTVETAWQLFYPLQRITCRQVAKNFTTIHDVSGLEYPEYPHTAIIGYNSLSSMTTDISGRWGLESASTFSVADFSFSGRTFNSYLFTMPLQPTTVSSPYYYLAVRNYSPTEKSQVLLRVSVPNLYDFGYLSPTDLSNETILASTMSNRFNPEYWEALNQFNSNFVIGSNGQVFGGGTVQGFAGSNLSNVAGFGDFYNRFVTTYNQYNSQVQLIQTINSNTNAAVEHFIQTDLQYILPASALNRQRYTDPLTFSIRWKSSLLPQYAKLEDNWGLGWNLGYEKADTTYETVHRADSFYKILDDYISLRLNPEFDMNRMDTGAKENFFLTLEPTGNIKAVHAKLLLANFGSFAQTVITNPISFNPPLARLDKLRFEWVDQTGTVIDNSDCEWNMVVQVAEKKEVATVELPFRLDPTVAAARR